MLDRYSGILDNYNAIVFCLVDRCNGLVDRYSETLGR